MSPFEWLEPTSLAEAIALLDADDPGVRPVSGGTALMLMMKAGVFAPTRLVCLQRLESKHRDIIVSDGALRIGALATLASLERSKPVADAFPAIARTLVRLSNPRVRNVACVGGALAHGDPHMDLPPVLAALDARVTLTGPAGSREVRVDELYTGYYETTVARNELITEVAVPSPRGRHAAYLKVTARTADDWPALGIAVAFRRDGERIADARVVASAATAFVVRLAAAEAILNGAAPDDAVLREAGAAAAAAAPVIGDARGSAGYKRELLRVYLGRAVRQALSTGGAPGRAKQ
jgi:aerobic carbon-monoxide dehydrogenase medium subunit